VSFLFENQNRLTLSGSIDSNTVGNKPETSVTFAAMDPESPEALDAMTAYFRELDSRFTHGFDPGDTLTADADQFREPNGRFVLGYWKDTVVSCGGIHLLKPTVVEIKRMWVDSDWRGRGIGTATLGHLEELGRLYRAETVYLDTNAVLDEAIALYTNRGYQSIDSYNDNPYAQRWYAKTLGPT